MMTVAEIKNALQGTDLIYLIFESLDENWLKKTWSYKDILWLFTLKAVFEIWDFYSNKLQIIVIEKNKQSR